MVQHVDFIAFSTVFFLGFHVPVNEMNCESFGEIFVKDFFDELAVLAGYDFFPSVVGFSEVQAH